MVESGATMVEQQQPDGARDQPEETGVRPCIGLQTKIQINFKHETKRDDSTDILQVARTQGRPRMLLV